MLPFQFKMSCHTSYNWSHDFPKLAVESGFAFNSHRPRVQLDWNRIKLVDVEKVVKSRDFSTIEKHINDVLDVQLESEFDLRILDSGVVKLFRLAQLAVEYQQFCRQYLDRSVLLLRDELTSKIQEIQKLRQDLKARDDEVRRTRKKSKHSVHRHHLPYGNENIAAMILKTLTHKSENVPSFGETINNYNKCPYCEKVFLNHLYLQAHIVRRHSSALDQAQRGAPSGGKAYSEKVTGDVVEDTSKLQAEIQNLRDRLNEIYNLQHQPNQHIRKQTENAIDENETSFTEGNVNPVTVNRNENQEVKESITPAHDNAKSEYKEILAKFEEWKKEEQVKYEKQMEALRRQLAESVETIREGVRSSGEGDSELVGKLKETVVKQEEKIGLLRDEIMSLQQHTKTEEFKLLEVMKQQEDEWRKSIEQQEMLHEKKMEQLLKTLENVYKEVRAAKSVSDEEKDKVSHLEELLEEKEKLIMNLNEKFSTSEKRKSEPIPVRMQDKENSTKGEIARKPAIRKDKHWENIAKRKSMEELHRKARELLSRNIDLESSSTDSDESNENKTVLVDNNKNDEITLKSSQSVTNLNAKPVKPKRKRIPLKEDHVNEVKTTEKKNREVGRGLNRHTGDRRKEDTSASQTKVVRAKLAEQVHSRLQELGVDPMKKGIDGGTFKKHQRLLREKQEENTKKNATYGRVRNKIVAFLDSKLSETTLPSTKSSIIKQSPNQNFKTFFSNVKTKAIAMMKPSERLHKIERNNMSDEISKRVADLIKTPPGSSPSSPLRTRKNRTNRNDLRSKQETFESKSQSVQMLYRRESVELTSSFSTESSSQESGVKVVTSAISHESLADKKFESSETLPVYSSKESMDTALDSLKRQQGSSMYLNASSSESEEFERKIFYSEQNLITTSSPKSVLKNAASVSSLAKKRVLFDMDAIQMKSVSASPSQSATDSDRKSEISLKEDSSGPAKGLTNEWDISSIEEEPPQKDRTDAGDVFMTRQSQKIAELTQKIESQLANRADKKPTGGVDVGQVPLNSSNTSVGSSLLDASNEDLKKPTPAPRSKAAKVDSDIDVSDWSVEEIFRGS